jgi:elongation factor 1-beta
MPFSNVADLNKHLATRSYVSGYAFSAEDRREFEKLTATPSASAHPHAYRWAKHIAALTGAFCCAAGASASCSGASASSGASSSSASAAAPAAAKKPDFDNMFEADDEDLDEAEAAAAKARKGRMEAARKLKEEKDARDGVVKKDKVKAVEKSLVVLEVKPWEADTDLKMVWEKICEYKQEGLTWGATFKLEPVAFGIMKLVMTATIVDSLVLMDDVTENIEALDQWVQSVEIASFNKIS